jgi:AcrR family transcriptional regulator
VATQTRDRILDTTAELFRRYGYTGTGLKQIVAEANAPFGSIYHFFPGGKQHLGEEVIRRSGQMYLELVLAVFDAAPDVVSGTSDVFTGAAAVLEETDYIDACPIETVALEVASSNEPLREATADVFESWIAAATARGVEAGIPEPKARELAVSFLASLEGAFVLSRAMRSTEALEVTGAAAGAAVREALAGVVAP